MKKRLIISVIISLTLGAGETGFASDIDPNNIGDTLTGTNHVTYSSTDPGDATGHVDVTNPDGSTQTIYYTYTMPENYSIITAATTATNEDITDKMFTGWRNAGSILRISGKSLKLDSDFTDNANYWGNGGAINISANSNIAEINGDFVKNRVSQSTQAHGGALSIWSSQVGDISGDYIENFAKSTGYFAYGGGIHVDHSNVGNITGNFIGNYVNASNWAWAGAIHISENSSSKNITGNFINNYATGEWVRGGAIVIDESAQTKDITGNFIGNYAEGLSGQAQGGAISSFGTKVGNISGNFINNHAKGQNANVVGGAIHIVSSTGNINANFNNNYLEGKSNVYGGAISFARDTSVGNINGNFISNYIKTESNLAAGGALSFWHGSSKKIGNISGNFYNNFAQSKDNAFGGAIYNISKIGSNQDSSPYGGIINSNFIDNYAKSESGTAKGGAIWTSSDLNIIADNGTSTFKDNYVQVGEGEKDYQAIWVEGADKKLNLQQFNNGKMYMYDNINGTDGYTVNIQGDGTGTYYMLNDIKNANVGFDNTTINTVNNNIHTYEFNSLALNSNTNFVADVDLVNEQMDHIETGNNYTITDGAKLTVSGMNLLNDAEKDSTKIFFAEEDLANNVDTTVKTVSYSPICKYDVKYMIDEDDNKGYFMFARGGNGGGGFNPAVLASPVATQAGVQATLNNTFNYAFNNADMFTKLNHNERMARINANRYASAASTDFNENLNIGSQYEDNSSVWFRPYAVFESIPLNNGPRVDAISYGTLVGFDTDFHHHKNGWNSVFTGYVGYNGAQLNYGGGDTSLNGGLLGVTETFYKNNFWTAITATTGASVAETNTMYGKDHSTSLMAGIGSKTGYNFEFFQGKFIIQPIWFMNYSFINTFNYKNAAGVQIDSKPVNTIQLNPSIRFIGNIKGWQPYASIGMVWNLMNKTDVSANGVHLPDMHIDPYVQYGIGLQKNVGDRFTGFLQAMMHNGGRNGISLTGGFRWALGKDKNQNKTSNKPDITPKITNAQFVK